MILGLTNSQFVRPPAACRTDGASAWSLMSTEVCAGQARWKTVKSAVISGTPPFPLASPFSTHFPPISFQICISQGTLEHMKTHHQSAFFSPKSKTNKGVHSIHFLRREIAYRNLVFCALSGLTPSFKLSSCLLGFYKDSKVPQTDTAAWFMAQI